LAAPCIGPRPSRERPDRFEAAGTIKTSLHANLPAQSGIYRHEFIAQALIAGLMAAVCHACESVEIFSYWTYKPLFDNGIRCQIACRNLVHGN